VGFSALRNGSQSSATVMFCGCSFLTGWNLLPVPNAEKNFEDVANMHVLVQSSTAWISPPPTTIWACHADRTECDRLSFSDQMMRHNRLTGLAGLVYLARLEW